MPRKPHKIGKATRKARRKGKRKRLRSLVYTGTHLSAKVPNRLPGDANLSLCKDLSQCLMSGHKRVTITVLALMRELQLPRALIAILRNCEGSPLYARRADDIPWH